jgi:tetratricopeptide (TPR) repeat protein
MEDNIAAAWKLFHTTNTNQMFKLGQTQLFLLQQIRTNLHPHIQAIHYSAVYRLLGATLSIQGDYPEADKFQKYAYRASLEIHDVWGMAQTLSWQAYRHMALGDYTGALEITQAALKLILHRNDLENIRLQARLLAFGAENAVLGSMIKEAETNLDASKALLDFLPTPHEEFDRANWHQYAGASAMHQGKLDVAIDHFQRSLNELPPQWILRYANTLLSLAKAYALCKERDASIATAEKAVSVICVIDGSSLHKRLINYIHADLLTAFPSDNKVRNFAANTQYQLSKSAFLQGRD